MIYENVVTLCKKRGISIAKLERLADLGNATIQGWRDSDPRISTLKKVADVLGVTVDELINGRGT